MVHDEPRHPQSQGSVERANGDNKDMLLALMGDNDIYDWSVDIKHFNSKIIQVIIQEYRDRHMLPCLDVKPKLAYARKWHSVRVVWISY